MGKFITPFLFMWIVLALICCGYYLGEKYLDNKAKLPCSCQEK